MTLEDWLTQNNVTDGSFAALVGVDRSTVSKLKRGKHNASLDLMMRVSKATSEAVTPNDLMATALGFAIVESERKAVENGNSSEDSLTALLPQEAALQVHELSWHSLGPEYVAPSFHLSEADFQQHPGASEHDRASPAEFATLAGGKS